VKGKTFAFTGGDQPVISVTAKPRPESREMFLQLPSFRVAAYVGRFGWLSMEVTDQAGLEVARDLIAESYAVISKGRSSK